MWVKVLRQPFHPGFNIFKRNIKNIWCEQSWTQHSLFLFSFLHSVFLQGGQVTPRRCRRATRSTHAVRSFHGKRQNLLFLVSENTGGPVDVYTCAGRQDSLYMGHTEQSTVDVTRTEDMREAWQEPSEPWPWRTSTGAARARGTPPSLPPAPPLSGQAAQGNMRPEHTQHARCALKKAPATDQVRRYQPTRHNPSLHSAHLERKGFHLLLHLPYLWSGREDSSPPKIIHFKQASKQTKTPTILETTWTSNRQQWCSRAKASLEKDPEVSRRSPPICLVDAYASHGFIAF